MPTKIEWTATVNPDGSVTPGETWNPIRARRTDTGKVGWHCEMISPGCAHCYSQLFNGRMLPNGGTGLDYTQRNRELVETTVHVPTLQKPLHWNKPRKVFVCSMTDLFGEWVTDQQIAQVFAVMAISIQHTFQVLTKRADRMLSWLTDYAAGGRHVWQASQVIQMPHGRDKTATRWPLPNVWLGVSVEDQQRANERIPLLVECPATVRFVSYEPAIGPVDFSNLIRCQCLDCRTDRGDVYDRIPEPCRRKKSQLIDWLITGGESGPRARPCNIQWIKSAAMDCFEADVACFIKQLGARPYDGDTAGCETGMIPIAAWLKLKDHKGGDMSEWWPGLRVREFPQSREIAHA